MENLWYMKDILKISLKSWGSTILKLTSCGKTNQIWCSLYNHGFYKAAPGYMFIQPDVNCETRKSCKIKFKLVLILNIYFSSILISPYRCFAFSPIDRAKKESWLNTTHWDLPGILIGLDIGSILSRTLRIWKTFRESGDGRVYIRLGKFRHAYYFI